MMASPLIGPSIWMNSRARSRQCESGGTRIDPVDVMRIERAFRMSSMGVFGALMTMSPSEPSPKRLTGGDAAPEARNNAASMSGRSAW